MLPTDRPDPTTGPLPATQLLVAVPPIVRLMLRLQQGRAIRPAKHQYVKELSDYTRSS